MKKTNLTTQKEPTKQKGFINQKELTKQKNLTKQKGFTLIELALVLVVMTIIATFTTKAYLFQKAFEREEARADKTVREIIQISEAMGGWRLDKGDWAGWVGAGAVNNCVSAIDLLTNPPSIPATSTTPANPNPTAYLRYVDEMSPYDTDYITSCDANNFTIEVKSNQDYAQYIRTKLAGTTIKAAPDDDTTITSIPRNTINPTLADFLPFTGTTNNRQMLGDIDMGNNAITNAANVEALDIKTLDMELNGQDIKLGIGKFISMGSQDFNSNSLTTSSLPITVNKPNCNQRAIMGSPKIILRIHGVTTSLGARTGIRNISWSAKFNDLSGTKQWQLSTTGLDAITGVAETFCDYGTWNR